MSDLDLTDDIEEARAALTPHVTRLKGLLQLWSIFTSAKTIADEYQKEYENLGYPLKMACTKSLVVDYYKPWSGNYSEELNSLRVFSSKKNWSYPFLQPVVIKDEHNQLREVRNSLVAHIDKNFEGLGVTVKGGTIQNIPQNRPQDEGTIDEVFLPALTLLEGTRGLWWLSDKDKLAAVCTHINGAKELTEEEIRSSTAKFRDACLDYMHVLKQLSDVFAIEELGFEAANIEVTSHADSPKPSNATTPVATQIGDQNTDSLVIFYEPKPLYPTNTEIKGKGYLLKLGNFDKGKLLMSVSFPKYPYPKEPVKN